MLSGKNTMIDHGESDDDGDKEEEQTTVTVASNMFHPRPNTLRPIEAKTQSIVSYEGVSEEGGGSPEKRP